MLNCKIKLIKTAKLLFGHCLAIDCHMGKDIIINITAITFILYLVKSSVLFHFVRIAQPELAVLYEANQSLLLAWEDLH